MFHDAIIFAESRTDPYVILADETLGLYVEVLSLVDTSYNEQRLTLINFVMPSPPRVRNPIWDLRKNPGLNNYLNSAGVDWSI